MFFFFLKKYTLQHKILLWRTGDDYVFVLIFSHMFIQVFIANPNKPREVKIILSKNLEKPLELLHNLSPGKGSEDEQFEEGKEFIIKEIERLSS
ncbi:hypothetical protein JHK82_041893 [Glycine max]|nr:hypothetical protein JHK82_041893 [Glycine max]KAG5116049.1 hypothetical protein JHK84_042162 [Glycine max]